MSEVVWPLPGVRSVGEQHENEERKNQGCIERGTKVLSVSRAALLFLAFFGTAPQLTACLEEARGGMGCYKQVSTVRQFLI